MSPLIHRAALGAALLLAAACADQPYPSEPDRNTRAGPTPVQGPVASIDAAEQGRHERLALRLALALGDPGFRKDFHDALQRSRVREGKVHLQRLLAENGNANRRRLAALTHEPETAIAADLDASAPIEVYLPVPAHRLRWKGDAEVLVATAERDHDPPVAFDIRGARRLLDPDRPPTTPVIALERSEAGFQPTGPAAADCIICDEDPTGGTSSGGTGATEVGTGGTTTSAVSPGLYMTYAKFTQTFEGWLKGDPEFEVHILGQDGTTSAMKSYQCAGEKAGAPYQYDQNGKEWSGSVLLFSQAQLNSYKTEHPTQGVRVFVVEDDDTPCAIKTDSTSLTRLFQQLASGFGAATGGLDSTFSIGKSFKRAPAYFSLLRSIWSFITTQDDVVGNAVEDAVAGEYWPSANWIVKGENSVTTGALRLEMH